jgi:hypothetical protein
MFLSILISVPYFFKYKGGFVFPVQLICVSILISVFMAKYTWQQGYEYSSTTIPYAMWFVFFFLLKLKIPIKTLENIIVIFGIIYIVLFLFQFTHTGVVYFGMQEEFKEDRGITRVNFPGGGVFFLSCFIAINKVTGNAKYKLWWLLFSLTGIVIIVMQVTRQEIFVLILLYLIHFLRNSKLFYKLGAIVLFCLCSYLFYNSGSSISKGLIEQQKNDLTEGKSYIRVLEAEYYLTQFTPNVISQILGNGFFNDNSYYGKSLIALNDYYGYYLTDVGLIEVYITFGIFALIAYFWIFIKSIIVQLPYNYYYLKYYLWFIMLTSLTSDFLISENFLITTVIVLYCYQSLCQEIQTNRPILKAVKFQ